MDRRTFLAGTGAVLLAAPPAAHAEQQSRIPRIAFLGTDSPAGSARYIEAFRQGLCDLGHMEGRNIAIEYRWAEGMVERLPGLAVELVGLKVDVIVASSTPAALAAKAATRTIPIVFVVAGDPVGSGLVAGIAGPGGNITGLSLLAPELVARQLQLLKEAVPKATRVAALSNPANPTTATMVKETEAAARSLKVRVKFQGVRESQVLESALSAVAKERPHALFVLFDPMLFAHRTRVAEFANKNRLPAMYPHTEYVEIGGLMAYGPDLRDNARRAAAYVDKT